MAQTSGHSLADLAGVLFFGLNDFLTGWLSRDIGADRWLILMMGMSGMISGLLLGRKKQVEAMVRRPDARRFVLRRILGVQAWSRIWLSAVMDSPR